DVLILDEPTSGLDPLMQNEFLELILSEKEKGKTIFMSSHNFEEIERTCDRTAIIKEGYLVAVEDMNILSQTKRKSFIITFSKEETALQFSKEDFEVQKIRGNKVTVSVKGNIKSLISSLDKYEIKDLDVKTQTLEELFMHYYGGGENV
ncbi:MAG TPA: ABC transporter ATP-binding protein, partial [Desulfosporosinus sp.]|nr:ABC transporter ATP-binding protein [Desulfosporosinus sp.]